MMDWFSMHGYGIYVWGSVGVVLVCLLCELTNLRMRYRAIRDEIQA